MVRMLFFLYTQSSWPVDVDEIANLARHPKSFGTAGISK